MPVETLFNHSPNDILPRTADVVYNNAGRGRAGLARRRDHQGVFPGIAVRRRRGDVFLYRHLN